MTPPPSAEQGSRGPIGLLAGQTFALGLTTVWVAVSATSIFLESFGAGALPLTYVGAAFAGIVVTSLLTRTLRTHPLTTVAVRVVGMLVTLIVASWVLLRGWDATWVSFALLMLVPILVPVGFVFIVGQAGMLLDVRALKASYARVIAGFALGVFVGGLVGPLLLSVLEPMDLLLAAGLASGALIALVLTTRRAFPLELSVVGEDTGPQERPTLRSVMANRFVRLIIAFQMLSAVESQWLDFLVNDRAAQRYAQTSELATFLSRFFAIAYGADIVFLLLLAGLLLRRFGLRYGLVANPGVVLAVVVALIGATLAAGSGATIVFVLVVASRVADLTLSDGAARASLGAAYQAVPTRQRTAAQALVEGLGVPVAIGFSGVVLLVMRATIGTGSLALPVFTSIVVFAWVVVAVLLYRGYRSSLLDNLRRRVLDPSELTVDETSGVEILDRLLESDDEHEVRLGLEALTVSGHTEMAARLYRVATGPLPRSRVDALERLVAVDPGHAHDAALHGLDDEHPEVRAGSLRALAHAGHTTDVAMVTALTGDVDQDVTVAAYSVLSRIGDERDRLEVAAAISALAAEPVAATRVLAARILAETGPDVGIDRAPLRDLLADADVDVVNAALSAVGSADDALLDRVVRHLERPRTARNAVDALVRVGDVALVRCDEGLQGEGGVDQRAQVLMARVCREVGSPEAVAILRRHLGHPDREVGLAVMVALAALGPAATEPTEDLVSIELDHAAHVLPVLRITPPLTALHLALLDEVALTRRRVMAALALRYGSDGIGRVAYQLSLNDPRSHGLALEWMDVTLVGDDKAAIAFVDPARSIDDHLRALPRVETAAPATFAAAVIALVKDRDGRWQSPWLISCALLAGADLPEIEFDELIDSMSMRRPGFWTDDARELVDETVAGVRRRRVRG